MLNVTCNNISVLLVGEKQEYQEKTNDLL